MYLLISNIFEMASDQIVEQLKLSSKKVAKQIAKLTLEKGKIQEDLLAFENSLTILEAKVEVHKEQRDKYHSELKSLKSEKKSIYRTR